MATRRLGSFTPRAKPALTGVFTSRVPFFLNRNKAATSEALIAVGQQWLAKAYMLCPVWPLEKGGGSLRNSLALSGADPMAFLHGIHITSTVSYAKEINEGWGSKVNWSPKKPTYGTKKKDGVYSQVPYAIYRYKHGDATGFIQRAFDPAVSLAIMARFLDARNMV